MAPTGEPNATMPITAHEPEADVASVAPSSTRAEATTTLDLPTDEPEAPFRVVKPQDVTAYTVRDIGKRVRTSVGTGTIRFVGLHAENYKERIGIELDEPHGDSNGVLKVGDRSRGRVAGLWNLMIMDFGIY